MNIKNIIYEQIKDKLNLKDRILLSVFKRYTFNIYRMGFYDGFIYCNPKGCNKAVITEKQIAERRNRKILKVNGE